MTEDYRPVDYWSERLSANCSLRGTGHISYSEGYNRWLYRAKRHALRRALRGVRPPFRALDVGSGVGWVVQELITRGADVDGCDIAEVAVVGLRERFPKATFFQATLGASPLPASDRSYDVITLLDVAYHITEDAAWCAGVGDLGRLLRPGGRLVVSDGLGLETRAPASHVRFRSRREWELAAASAGLRLLRVDPYFRWLSRDRTASRLATLPDGWRGAIEYGLERIAPMTPHMRCAVFTSLTS